MITKYIDFSLSSSPLFDVELKTAGWRPDVYVPEEISRFIETFKPEPSKFAYFHLIAMSDGEKYGQNMNGDIFTEEELTGTQSPKEAEKNRADLKGIPVPRYKTFEQAKVFRDHDNRPTSPAYGDVPCAGWNPVMKRVELVIRVPRRNMPELGLQSGADLISQYEQTGRLEFSMGTTIVYEKCTYCGAENEFISQRCPHLARQMGQIMPNGVKVGALNYGMRFFDISKVGIPADPIALSLAKVASAFRVNRAEDLVPDVGAKAAWLKKRSEIEKIVPAESSLSDCVVYDPAAPTGRPTPFTGAELDEAMKAANRDLGTVLSTLALAGVVLSPAELVYLGGGMEKSAAELAPLDPLTLDNFHSGVYDALRSKIGSRSGFVAACPVAEWGPAKIAEQTDPTVAGYYGLYRAYLGVLPKSTFVKAAHRVSHVRDLHRGDPDRIQSALYHLVHAGLDAPL